MSNLRNRLFPWLAATALILVNLQILTNIYRNYPELLSRVGILQPVEHVLTVLGTIPNDPLWKLSQSDRKTRLKQRLKDIDEYSTYLSEEQFESFSIDSKQEYQGIGVSLVSTYDGILIHEVFPEGPAERAGITEGDLIKKIEGYDVSNWTFDRSIDVIRGRRGTLLNLTISRDDEIQDIAVRRDYIEIPSVSHVHLTEDGILYARIEQFGEKTGQEFFQKIRPYTNQALQGLVIDLRDNTGGVLRSSLDILDAFYDRGQLMLKTIGRENHRSRIFRAKKSNLFGSLPTVLLVNQNTASASEIIAGSLQSTERAILIGEKTLGKGSIQTVYELRNGEAYKKTTGYYYMPDGSSIDKVGLRPDIRVRQNRESYWQYRRNVQSNVPPYEAEYDAVWEAALKYLN